MKFDYDLTFRPNQKEIVGHIYIYLRYLLDELYLSLLANLFEFIKYNVDLKKKIGKWLMIVRFHWIDSNVQWIILADRELKEPLVSGGANEVYRYCLMESLLNFSRARPDRASFFNFFL